MIFKIAHFELNTDTRELIDGERKQLIRPKTMALLLYLMERQGTLVTKGQLLEEVWDDVTVHEGVIFQSIREIRTLFGDLPVVQNHPRKGYQWLIPVQRQESQAAVADKLGKSGPLTSKKSVVAAACIALILAIAIAWHFMPMKNQPLLQLSVQNRIDRNDLDALQQEKLAAFAVNLQQSLTDMEVSAANLEPPATDSVSTNAKNWALDIKLYGDIYDFKLVYSLKNHELTISNAILSYSLEDAFTTLHDQVTHIVQGHINKQQQQWSEFAEVVTAFETDWEMALPKLKQFVSRFPDNIEAQLMLSRLLLWQSQQETALHYCEQALSNPKLTSSQQARFQLLKAQALYPGSAPNALQAINKGLTVAVEKDAWLVRAELEELQGDILRQQGDVVVALRSYLKAQSIYDEINLPVNAAGLKLKLSGLHLDMGQMVMAQRFYQQARLEIQSREMSFLYGQLEEYAQRIEPQVQGLQN